MFKSTTDIIRDILVDVEIHPTPAGDSNRIRVSVCGVIFEEKIDGFRPSKDDFFRGACRLYKQISDSFKKS